MKAENEKLIKELLIHKFVIIKRIKAINTVINILKQEKREKLQYDCREAREKTGMSVKELAKKASTGLSTIYNLESGRYVHPKTYTKIFNILELTKQK